MDFMPWVVFCGSRDPKLAAEGIQPGTPAMPPLPLRGSTRLPHTEKVQESSQGRADTLVCRHRCPTASWPATTHGAGAPPAGRAQPALEAARMEVMRRSAGEGQDWLPGFHCSQTARAVLSLHSWRARRGPQLYQAALPLHLPCKWPLRVGTYCRYGLGPCRNSLGLLLGQALGRHPTGVLETDWLPCCLWITGSVA